MPLEDATSTHYAEPCQCLSSQVVLILAMFLCIPVSSLTRRRKTGHRPSGLQRPRVAESLPSRRAQLPLQSARLNFSTEASNVDITAADNVRVPAGS